MAQVSTHKAEFKPQHHKRKKIQMKSFPRLIGITRPWARDQGCSDEQSHLTLQTLEFKNLSQAWWHMSVISALEAEAVNLRPLLTTIARFCLKIQKKKKKKKSNQT
jgi:hypothetical protein